MPSFIATIGSDPGVRGRGFGQALMRSRLNRCDAEHAPAYLEFSKPENSPYYERLGFTVTGEIVTPGGGPTLWPMWHAPRGVRLVTGDDGQPMPMAADTGDGIDPSDFPEEDGPGDTLNQSESMDSDEIRNDDGDIVVDPPEGWSGVDKWGITAREEREGEPLDIRLAEEEPDVTDVNEEYPLEDSPPGRAHHGQIDGAPEDGESLFEVVDESGDP